METFPPQEQAMAMTIWGMGMMVAPIMGPTIGGWITDTLSWRWNFYINVQFLVVNRAQSWRIFVSNLIRADSVVV